MLTHNDRAELINLAIQAEAECYNAYFMQGATDVLKKFANTHGTSVVWNFLINASECTYRLYLEFCLVSPAALKENVSYEVS